MSIIGTLLFTSFVFGGIFLVLSIITKDDSNPSSNDNQPKVWRNL